jgi:hypothetical protein
LPLRSGRVPEAARAGGPTSHRDATGTQSVLNQGACDQGESRIPPSLIPGLVPDVPDIPEVPWVPSGAWLPDIRDP